VESVHSALALYLPASSKLLILLQLTSIIVFSMVAGATFGIWRGYNPADLPADSFMLMHQGAVRGLNTLLPMMAVVSILLTVILLLRSYGSTAFVPYGLALLLMVAGGVITRTGNQPINEVIMRWTVGAIPADWASLRDTWWHWHLARTGISIAALTLLVLGALNDQTF